MKSITTYITEKLKIKKLRYNYFPETTDKLQSIIEERIKTKVLNVT